MTIFVPLKDLENQFAELTARVEAGETVVVTRDGRPVFDWTPHKAPGDAPKTRGGIDLEAGRRFLLEHGITNPVPYIAEDFDDPLPEDFLIRPLPFD